MVHLASEASKSKTLPAPRRQLSKAVWMMRRFFSWTSAWATAVTFIAAKTRNTPTTTHKAFLNRRVDMFSPVSKFGSVLSWSNNQDAFSTAEYSRYTAGHQRRQRRGQERAQAEAGEIVAARWRECCSAADEDRHRSDVCEAAESVTQDHNRSRIGYLPTRDHLGQMIVGEDFCQYHSLA